jgi:hypothetical protein
MKPARRGSSHLVERLGVARTVRVVTVRKPWMRCVASMIWSMPPPIISK